RSDPGGASQHRLDTGHNLAWRRRLHDIVVAADAKATYLVGVALLRAEEEDWHIGGLADIAAELETRHAGHHYIEWQAAYRTALELLQRIIGLKRGFDPISLGLEEIAHEFGNRLIVVNHQHRRLLHHTFLHAQHFAVIIAPPASLGYGCDKIVSGC